MPDTASSRTLAKNNMDEQIQPVMIVGEEKTWPAILFRCESDGSWKKQEFVTDSAASSSIVRNAQHDVRNQHFVAVAPRKDCIVFPDLRQRFSLKSETDQGTVIRRDDNVLLTSKRRMRALLLQFQSLQDCLDFTDHFLALNTPPQPSLDEEEAAASSQRELERVHGRQPASSDEQEQVVSYITRLLHDEDFLQFVHKVETYIARTDDGAKILRGLEERDLSSI